MSWYNGSGNPVEFEEIIKLVKMHGENGGTIYIGTDSHMKRGRCAFGTAICLLGLTDGVKNQYFVIRKNAQAKSYSTLLQRITDEVQRSVDLGLRLLEDCPKVNIELHLDISPEGLDEKTSKFSKMLVGYAKGSGFDCKIKPEAFAASSVADKHSKVIIKGKNNENKGN